MTPRTSGFLFFDRTVGRRLYLIVLIMALGVLGILAIAAQQAREAMWTAKGAETRHLVETAHSLVAHHQRRAALGELTEAAARQAARVRPALSVLVDWLQQRRAA